jgi:hypothetical protein
MSNDYENRLTGKAGVDEINNEPLVFVPLFACRIYRLQFHLWTGLQKLTYLLTELRPS